ncbi:uncharacterized protein LOC143803913 [Ranitomeya variabilis]|uniref:uncharacterized protein LOC143803913 n=1 Tax=Ranitomeya variabilis TaxID=490064 RepID=UPI004055DFD8
MESQYQRAQYKPALTSTPLEECLSPDYRNNFNTQNYELFESVAAEALEVIGPALHLITDSDTDPSVYMPEDWHAPEPCEDLDSDVVIVDVKNDAASKSRGNSLSGCLWKRKDTPDLQPRDLQCCNYGCAQNHTQRADVVVRTAPLSPICVEARAEGYAAPKHTGDPIPKIPCQKSKNASRKRFAALNDSPCITQESDSTDNIPQVTSENREYEQLSVGMWSPTGPFNIRVRHAAQSADSGLAGSSSDFDNVLPLKKRAVPRHRVSKKHTVAEHSCYRGAPVWNAEHIKIFIAMAGQYAEIKLAQVKLKSFCDTYERLITACPTPDIIAELYAFKLNHSCVHTHHL